ncbi:MAG: hypothetical protein ACC661_08735 [Verrucomicrobiales bacterium]
MNKLLALTLCGLILFGPALVSVADISDARDKSYIIALSSKRRGYQVADVDINGHLFAGEYYNFQIDVVKGVDYAFLVGGDIFATDIDLYIFDEEGNEWQHDITGREDAGIEKRASYTGRLDVYIHMAGANKLASFSVLIGYR